MAGEQPPMPGFIATLRRLFRGCPAARYLRTHISYVGVAAITAALAACHPSTYNGSIPWPDGPWSLTVANYAPYVIRVTPWKGGPAKSLGCGTSAVFTAGAGGAPPLPWDVVVHGTTGDDVLDQQTVQGSPPQEVDVETSGAAMRDYGGSLSFPGNVC
jgi:hypothetical protein